MTTIGFVPVRKDNFVREVDESASQPETTSSSGDDKEKEEKEKEAREEEEDIKWGKGNDLPEEDQYRSLGHLLLKTGILLGYITLLALLLCTIALPIVTYKFAEPLKYYVTMPPVPRYLRALCTSDIVLGDIFSWIWPYMVLWGLYGWKRFRPFVLPMLLSVAACTVGHTTFNLEVPYSALTDSPFYVGNLMLGPVGAFLNCLILAGLVYRRGDTITASSLAIFGLVLNFTVSFTIFLTLNLYLKAETDIQRSLVTIGLQTVISKIGIFGIKKLSKKDQPNFYYFIVLFTVWVTYSSRQMFGSLDTTVLAVNMTISCVAKIATRTGMVFFITKYFRIVYVFWGSDAVKFSDHIRVFYNTYAGDTIIASIIEVSSPFFQTMCTVGMLYIWTFNAEVPWAKIIANLVVQVVFILFGEFVCLAIEAKMNIPLHKMFRVMSNNKSFLLHMLALTLSVIWFFTAIFLFWFIPYINTIYVTEASWWGGGKD